ncbi:MAG TPA: GNAT family N-acetyltransferase [Capsulimonadaceae bacterium]|nr:GNAT family N-acetyltransferase [Capsulimonadaceae bacterium]
MQIEIQEAAYDEKTILRNLLELYEYDESELTGHDLDEHGLFGYKYLDHYWTEEGRHPFLIHVDDKIAGFALVNQHSLLGSDARVIAEFFILRKYRRHRVGEEAARQVLDRLPGSWEIAQTSYNAGAQAFWKKLIDRYTNGRFTETLLDNDLWQGPVLAFDNSK